MGNTGRILEYTRVVAEIRIIDFTEEFLEYITPLGFVPALSLHLCFLFPFS